MKKYLLSAAIVAAMVAGSAYGYRTMNPNDGLSDAQLANIEALSDMERELPEIPVVCSGTNQGKCMVTDDSNKVPCEGKPDVPGCKFTGVQTDWCTIPCYKNI